MSIFKSFVIVSFFQLAFSSPSFCESPLSERSLAPDLKIEKWLKGTPVEKFQPGRIYIVEFWATWCGPCINGIPHLNALAKKYGQDVTVIGVAASEHGNSSEEKRTKVEKFLERGEPAIDYVVAFDGSGEMNKLWLEAAERFGIPTSFVVGRDGRLAFISHPAELDSEELGNPLEQIIGGTWLESTQFTQYKAEAAEEKNVQATYQLLTNKIIEADKQQNWLTFYNLAVQGAWLPAPYGAIFRLHKARMLVEHLDRPEGGLEIIRGMIQDHWSSVQGLGHILELLVHDKMPANLRDRELSDRVAKQAMELALNYPDKAIQRKFLSFAYALLPPISDYYFKVGQPGLAVELQQRAIASLTAESEEERPELEKNLALYQQALTSHQASVEKTAVAAAVVESTAMICEGGVCRLPTDDDCEKKL